MTTTSLFFIFFPLAIVMIANALKVPNNPTMKVSILIAGLGILGVSVYWGVRAAGLIEVSIPILVVVLALVAIGLYSVFGTPLFLELTKWRKK